VVWCVVWGGNLSDDGLVLVLLGRVGVRAIDHNLLGQLHLMHIPQSPCHLHVSARGFGFRVWVRGPGKMRYMACKATTQRVESEGSRDVEVAKDLGELCAGDLDLNPETYTLLT
jgi:hypothetical protein